MAIAQLGGQSDEALTDGVPSRQLSAVSADVLTAAATIPTRQLSGLSIDALTISETAPRCQLVAISAEVLVPARLTFAGWGSPILTSTWN